MDRETEHGLDRREFLTRAVPVCTLACLGAQRLFAQTQGDGAAVDQGDVHPFDVKQPLELSVRQRVRMRNTGQIGLIESLRGSLGDGKTIELLNEYSAGVGRDVGKRQAERSEVNDFETFVRDFRPPAYANYLTHEIVEDSEKVFSIRVTECVWAEVYREAGLGGEIGHAAVCNMDYHWPRAFNENFRMERDQTLMQGHACCNHRYVDLS